MTRARNAGLTYQGWHGNWWSASLEARSDTGRRKADEMRPAPQALRRILVIANETCAGERVVEEVRYRAGGGPAEVLVVAPTLARSRLGHWLSADMDRRRAGALERLDRSVAALGAAGLTARGEIGDADPLQAMDDAIRTFRPDEIIISTHPPARSSWLELRVVQRARELVDLPITHIVVDLEHEAELVTHFEGRRRRAGGERILLYYAAPYDEAMRIRQAGFHDSPDARRPFPGVVLTDRPPEGDEAPVVFGVRVPEDVAARFETTREGEESRSFLMPAGLVNRLGPSEVVPDLLGE